MTGSLWLHSKVDIPKQHRTRQTYHRPDTRTTIGTSRFTLIASHFSSGKAEAVQQRPVESTPAAHRPYRHNSVHTRPFVGRHPPKNMVSSKGRQFNCTSGPEPALSGPTGDHPAVQTISSSSDFKWWRFQVVSAFGGAISTPY